MGQILVDAVGALADSFLDAAEIYTEGNGAEACATLLKGVGVAAGTFEAFCEEHPVQAIGGLLAGMAAITLIGPEALAATAGELAATNTMKEAALVLGEPAVSFACKWIIETATTLSGQAAFDEIYKTGGALSGALGGLFTSSTDENGSTFGVSGLPSDTPDGTLSQIAVSQGQVYATSSDGSLQVTSYSGPDASASTTLIYEPGSNNIVSLKDVENADGTSEITKYDPTTEGSITTFYQGRSGTGAINEIDVENADGTSAITTVDPSSGTRTTTHFTGANGTGATGAITLTTGSEADGDLNTVVFGRSTFYFKTTRASRSAIYEQAPFTCKAGVAQTYPAGADVFGYGENNPDYNPIFYHPPGNTWTASKTTTTTWLSEGLNVSGNYDTTMQFGVENLSTGQTAYVPLTFIGKIYQPATAAWSGFSFRNVLNLGIVHVGDVASGSLSVENSATGALVDVINGQNTYYHSIAENGVAADRSTDNDFSANSIEGLTSGDFENVVIQANTSQAGHFSTDINPHLVSHDDDLHDIAMLNQSFSVYTTVYNYAQAELSASGVGDFSSAPGVGGPEWTLNLGTVTQGSKALTEAISVLNAAASGWYTDTLSGSFSLSGGGFNVRNANSFSGIGGGKAYSGIRISTDTQDVGSNIEILRLTPTSVDQGGSTTQSVLTLVITDDVVPTSGSDLIQAAAAFGGGHNGISWADLPSSHADLGYMRDLSLAATRGFARL